MAGNVRFFALLRMTVMHFSSIATQSQGAKVPSSEGKDKYSYEFFSPFFPTLAALASLREIFRVLVAGSRAVTFAVISMLLNIFSGKPITQVAKKFWSLIKRVLDARRALEIAYG